jgi:REP element-mobilizing transposase RayT
MRANRVLVPKGWYWVSTDVNNREAVFQSPQAVRRLREVLHEAWKIYEFEVRGLRVEDDRASFYINDADEVAVILLNRGQPTQKKCANFERFEKKPLFSRWIKVYTLVIALVQCGKLFPKKHGEEVCV